MALDHTTQTTDVSQAPEFELRTSLERNSRSTNTKVTLAMRWQGTTTSYVAYNTYGSVDAALADLVAQARVQLTRMEEEFAPTNE